MSVHETMGRLGYDTHLSNELANLVRRRLLRRRVLDAQLRLQPVRAKPPPRSLAPASVARKSRKLKTHLTSVSLLTSSTRADAYPTVLPNWTVARGVSCLLNLVPTPRMIVGSSGSTEIFPAPAKARSAARPTPTGGGGRSDGARSQSCSSSHTPPTGARSKDALDSKAVAAAPTNFRVRLCD